MKMSNKDLHDNRIRSAIDECLSGVEKMPSLRYQVLQKTRGDVKVKKKISIGFVLVIVLILATATALAVGAVKGIFKLEKIDFGSMRGCVSTGDTLYLMTSGGLYTWVPDDDEPTLRLSADALCEQDVSFDALIFRNDDVIGILDQGNKKLWAYQSGRLNLQLDYSNTAMDLRTMRYTAAVHQDGWLFLVAQPLEDAMEGGATLYRVNPVTGDAEELEIGGALELCAYEPGELLLLQYDGVTQKDRLVALDTNTCQINETWYTTHIQGIKGIAYDKAHGLYALVGGSLSRWEGSGWTALQSYASHHLTNAYAVVGEGYVSVSFDGMQYVPLEWENDLIPLTIRGYMASDNADEEFQKENPGVAVQRECEPTLTAADVRKAIEAGDTTDLFHLRLDGDLDKIIQDGFLAPLNSSSVLITDAQEIISVVQNALFHEGRLYAVPSMMSPMAWQGEYALPNTYNELLELIDEMGSNAPVIAWDKAEKPWAKEDYANYLLETFIAESVRDDKTVDFHEEGFANALMALKNLTPPCNSTPFIQGDINPGESIDLGGEYPKNLPESGERFYELETAQPDEIYWQLPPTIVHGAKPSVPIWLVVYVLNPNAKNPEAAMEYLEYIAAHRAPGDEGLFKPDLAEPVLRPSKEVFIDFIIEDQRGADKARGICTDEAALQAQVDAICAAPDSWAITDKRLDTYRKVILPHLDLRRDPLLSLSSKKDGGIYDLLLKTVLEYVSGNQTLKACLDGLQTLVNE